MGESVNVEKVLEIIKKNLMSIIVLTISVGIIAALITFFLISPRYEAHTQILVSQSEESTVTNYENIETSLQLINTYSDIIHSPTVLDEVINNLELDQAAAALSNQITVGNEEQSQVLTVTVADESPQHAERVANEVAGVFQEKVMEIMNVDNVSILSAATRAADMQPVSPQPLINITIGIVIGLLMGLTLAFSRAFFDKSVKNEGEVEKHLELPVVGSIARFED